MQRAASVLLRAEGAWRARVIRRLSRHTMRWLSSSIIIAAVAAAQGTPQAADPAAPPDPLSAAQQNAERAAKSWMILAQGLDLQLAPLLPCDPKARKAVQDTSKASDARVAALGAYLRLIAAQAADQTAEARRRLASEEARAPETADDRTDAALERSAVEAQSMNLSGSADSRPGLREARNILAQIADISGRRSALVDRLAGERDRGVTALRGLVAAYQAREAALKDEMAAFQSEASRWNTYYSVRLARVQAECSAIGAAAPVRPAPKTAKKAPKQ